METAWTEGQVKCVCSPLGLASLMGVTVSFAAVNNAARFPRFRQRSVRWGKPWDRGLQIFTFRAPSAFCAWPDALVEDGNDKDMKTGSVPVASKRCYLMCNHLVRKHSTHLFDLKEKRTKRLWGWITSCCYFHLWHLCEHKLRKWCSPLSLVLRLWLITEFWVIAMNILPGSVSWVQLLFFNVFQRGKIEHIILMQGRKRLQMFFSWLSRNRFIRLQRPWERARDTEIDPNFRVRLMMNFKSLLSWCETKVCFSRLPYFFANIVS